MDLFVKGKKIGLVPGTVKSDATEEPVVKIISYGPNKFREMEIFDVHNDISSLLRLRDSQFADGFAMHWVSVVGQMHHETISNFQSALDLHPLLCEDLVNTDQRPKFEDYENYFAVFMRSMHRSATYQVAVIVLNNMVVTFSEQPIFEPLEERVKSAKGKIRSKGTEYLLYALMDVVVDGYFVGLERLGNAIEKMEPAAIAATQKDLLYKLHELKKSIMLVKRAIWPVREVVTAINREIDKETEYFRDLYDHVIRVAESTDTYRDVITGLQEVYMTSIGNRLNNIMKVLTLISALFIPITFITGFFGMNFIDMNPILKDHNIFYGTMGGMIILTTLLLIVFKTKKWM